MKPKTKLVRKNALLIQDAAKSVLGGMTIREAAEKYNISKSAVGRAVKMARGQEQPENFKYVPNIGNRKVFLASDETAIAEYLSIASKMCYGLTKMQTRQLAYEYGIALNRQNIPESWHLNRRAGKQWIESF